MLRFRTPQPTGPEPRGWAQRPSGSRLALITPLRQFEPMPQVLNIRNLPGFSQRRPIIPLGAVYIGRANRWYRLPKSKWANPFAVRLEADRETAIASYERWLRSQPQLMAALPELRGHDLVCWCAPLPCHGDVLLRLASE